MARQTELPSPWAELADQHGGAYALAASLGVDHSSLYRWAHHMSNPAPNRIGAIEEAFIKASLPIPALRSPRLRLGVRNALTHDRLASFLDYNPTTGVFKRHRRKEPATVNPDNLRAISIDGVVYPSSHLAFLFMTGQLPPTGFLVDHANRQPGDNRWCNLRLATPQQNLQNSYGPSPNWSSAYKGVSKADPKTWKARFNDLTQLFHNEESAAEWVDLHTLDQGDEFDYLNFPISAPWDHFICLGIPRKTLYIYARGHCSPSGGHLGMINNYCKAVNLTSPCA
jgi:hypothetical protein